MNDETAGFVLCACTLNGYEVVMEQTTSTVTAEST